MILLVLSACLEDPAAFDTRTRVVARSSVLDLSAYGAYPGDGEDDAPAFASALEDLWASGDPDPVLEVPEGVWELRNDTNAAWSVLVDRPVTIRGELPGKRTDVVCNTDDECPLRGFCDRGTCVEGTLFRGDDLSARTHKDIWFVRPVAGEVLEGVHFENIGIEYPRGTDGPWPGQAHAIALSGGDGWVRDVSVVDFRMSDLLSGDGVYCGTRCEGLLVSNGIIEDVGRNGISVAGTTGTGSRFGYVFEDLDIGWSNDRRGAIDFEPSKAAVDDTIYDVVLDNVVSPRGRYDLARLDDALVVDVFAALFNVTRVRGLKIVRPRMYCLPNEPGQGQGYCIDNNRPEFDMEIVDGVFSVHPDGEGLMTVQDWRTAGELSDTRRIYDVEISGVASLEGHPTLNPNGLVDELLLRLDIEDL